MTIMEIKITILNSINDFTKMFFLYFTSQIYLCLKPIHMPNTIILMHLPQYNAGKMQNSSNVSNDINDYKQRFFSPLAGETNT